MRGRRASCPVIEFSVKQEESAPKEDLLKAKLIPSRYSSRRSSVGDCSVTFQSSCDLREEAQSPQTRESPDISKCSKLAKPSNVRGFLVEELGSPETGKLPNQFCGIGLPAGIAGIAGGEAQLPGVVVLDETAALASGEVEEKKALTALDDAMVAEDSKVLEAAISRAKHVGVDSSKLLKAEGILKKCKAAEMRRQMQSQVSTISRNKPREFVMPTINIQWRSSRAVVSSKTTEPDDSLLSPTSFERQLQKSKSCAVALAPSPEALAAIAGMQEAFVLVSEKGDQKQQKDPKEQDSWLQKSMNRARRASLSEAKQQYKTLT